MKNKNIKYHKSNPTKKYVIDLRSKGGHIMRFKTYDLANKHYKKYVDKLDQEKELSESFDWSFDDLLFNEDHGFKQNEHTRIQNGEILESTYEKKHSYIN